MTMSTMCAWVHILFLFLISRFSRVHNEMYVWMRDHAHASIGLYIGVCVCDDEHYMCMYCNEGTLLTCPLKCSQHDSVSFFSFHSISAQTLSVQSSPWLYYLYSTIPFLSPLSLLLFFTFNILLFFLFPYVCWATVCLSVRLWIIEVYWVWSADGGMAVIDLSVLFRNHWVYADTCPVKAHRSFAEAQGTVEGGWGWGWGLGGGHAP